MTADSVPGHPRHTSTSTRRTLLKAAGLTALFGMAGTAPARAAGRGSRSDDHDVIVIGAGFAGVTAARELTRNGRRPLVLEARGRVGGRTRTDEFAGEMVDFGGAWFDETHPHAWPELQHYGLELATDDAPDITVFPAADGYRTYDPSVGFGRQADLVTPVFDGSRDYLPQPLDPFAAEDRLHRVDPVSLRERIEALKLGTVDLKWVRGSLGGLSGGSARGALTQMAQWFALSDWDYQKFAGAYSSRLVDGTAALLARMLDESAADLRLNAPVSAVVDDGEQVRVTTRDGEVHSAPQVVVAVPVNVWNDIAFSPELPRPYRTMAREGVSAPTAKKVWLRIRSDEGMFFARADEGVTALSSIVPAHPLDDGFLAYGFSLDPSLDVTDLAQLQSVVEQFVPGARVLEAAGHDWGKDPFARGGWTFKQPGQLTGELRQVQRPFGRLAFATSDIASGWSGWIDGAIESGLRAAGQVLDA